MEEVIIGARIGGATLDMGNCKQAPPPMCSVAYFITASSQLQDDIAMFVRDNETDILHFHCPDSRKEDLTHYIICMCLWSDSDSCPTAIMTFYCSSVFALRH